MNSTKFSNNFEVVLGEETAANVTLWPDIGDTIERSFSTFGAGTNFLAITTRIGFVTVDRGTAPRDASCVSFSKY